MRRELLNYNFVSSDVEDGDFNALFKERRRDAMFAYAYEADGRIFAIRDHLGTVPLFYRHGGNEVRFATDLESLIRPGDQLDVSGLRVYLALGTTKLQSVVRGIEVVPPGTVLELDPESGAARVVYRYKIAPAHISQLATMGSLVEEFDRLFVRALERVLQADSVGLYLSGGIDSAMIGLHLKRLGVKVNAYTSGPWGKTSTELPLARANAERIGVEAHHIDCLETDRYAVALDAMPRLYRQPHGTSTGLGVANLWMNTPIGRERQVFSGQNSDTMTCSMSAQSIVFFTSFLPKTVRRRLGIHQHDLRKDYISRSSHGYIEDWPPLADIYDVSGFNKIQLLTMWGMFAGHTPADGELLAQPAISKGMLVSDPYYDMDLIEFCMGIPLRHRVSKPQFAKKAISLQKKILQANAIRFLPKEIVFRKKGFKVPMERDEVTKRFVEMLPTQIEGLPVKDVEIRVRAGILEKWWHGTAAAPGG